MIWFLQSRQAQTLKDSSVTNSTLQLTQAGRDALSFQNVEQVAISYNGLFGSRQIVTGIDWEWAGRVLHEQHAEVRNRLKYVLCDRAPMNVQLSEQPERVNLPALESERRLMIAGQYSELLDPGQLMIEVFGREDIVGKLLILGTPGAGKTTVLLSLAEQLLVGAIASPQTCIPIIFELSTWKNDNQPIQDWLIEQLYDLYGGDRKLRRYEQWLEKQVLLPLLDGLDELGMERQQKCMAKLNEFTRQYRQVVVCCRSKEFEESGIQLGNLRGAVALEPLSDRQIQTYLQQVEREGLWQQIQKTPEMQQMLEPNDGEAGLLRVPLFVSLAASIYDANQPFRTKGELLERYIDRQLRFDIRSSDRRKELERRKWAYATPEKEPSVKLTLSYLAWLARQLDKSSEVNFLLEKMQPSWLEKPQHKRLYRLTIALFFVLTNFNISINGLIGCLITGLIFALIPGLNDIQPVESFQFTMSRARRRKITREFKKYGLTGALIGGLFLGLIFVVSCLIVLLERGASLIYSLNVGLRVGLNLGLPGGLIIGLISGLVGGITSGLKQDIKQRSYPNQGIRSSFYNFCFFIIIVFAISLASFLLGSIPAMNFFTVIGLLIVVSGPTCVFLSCGGLAFVRHFCLRFVLAYTGTFPFFCVRFLNYCSERRLLQRIGGRYRFIHRELLEHFAKQGN